MTGLLEWKEKIKSFYAKYEFYLQPLMKFMVTFMVFLIIASNIGYMSRLTGLPILLLLALICALLPINGAIAIAGMVIVLHMYALSIEVALAVIIIFFMGYLIYFRFAPKEGYTVLLTPLCLHFNIGPIMPVSSGLLGEAYSVISVIFGTFVYYFMAGIRDNASVLGDTASEDLGTSKITVIMNQLFGNKQMYLVIISFAVTMIIVYLIRKLSIEHAWTIAIIIGLTVNFLIQFSGLLMLGITGKTLGLTVGTIIALPIAFFLQFLFFNLDYSRTERVQFEDDEYYYYVKAVPKITVSGKSKQVKKFSTTDFEDEEEERMFEEMRKQE